MYYALNPKRTRLPSLEVVRVIVTACTDTPDEANEWIMAWKAIKVQEVAHAEGTPAGQPARAARPPTVIWFLAVRGNPQDERGA